MKNFANRVLARIGYCSKPDFLIIGAQKAGTSGLFSTLEEHSLIIGSRIKEVHYFDNDTWYSEGRLSSYHSFFPLPYEIPKKAKLFESTPLYLFHPEVALRLHGYNSKLKLIVLLRNPVERAFSAWTMYHHHFKAGAHRNLHDPRTFEEAVNEELKNIRNTQYTDNKIAYVKRGMYHFQVEEYLKYFPMNQLLFIESGDLKENANRHLRRIQSFVEVDYEDVSLRQANKSKVAEYDSSSAAVVKLIEFYRPYNEKLFDLIGEQFDWD